MVFDVLSVIHIYPHDAIFWQRALCSKTAATAASFRSASNKRKFLLFLGVLLTRSYMIFAPPTVNCSSNVHEFFFFQSLRAAILVYIHVVYVPTSKAAVKKSPHHQPHHCCKNHNRIHGRKFSQPMKLFQIMFSYGKWIKF